MWSFLGPQVQLQSDYSLNIHPENKNDDVLISAQKVLFLTLFEIGFECFLRTSHIN